jgi:hypothetical protein
LLATSICGLSAFVVQLGAGAFLRAAEDEKAPAIVIRPANFDPADELAYTRERGELKTGAVAGGKIWNKPVEDSRAAVSGEAPAPAGATDLGPLVSAASGKPALRMTYAEALRLNRYLAACGLGSRRGVETAARHRVPAKCVWLDTPLAQAQVNLVERLLEQFGSLPQPEQLRSLARRVPGVLLPTSQMRAVRELEPPSTDEGLASVERLPFARTPSPAGLRAFSAPAREACRPTLPDRIPPR